MIRAQAVAGNLDAICPFSPGAQDAPLLKTNLTEVTKMPVYLKDINDFSELERFGSVLIVPCRFCPAASLALRRNAPYFRFWKNFLKTAAYEQYLEAIRSDLEQKGVKTDIFKSYWPHQFVVCMWTSRRRKKLMKRARNYDAVVVMGCETAVQTIHEAVESPSCSVFQGMRTEGIMSIKPLFQFPGNISLELSKVTPLLPQTANFNPWVCL